MRRPPAFLLVLLALAAPATAGAAVPRAEGVLPPGQSGFVSLTGLTSGTGSPHLNDQTPLFVDFRYKPLTFGQPGKEETPRPGVRIVRDAYGVPAVYADNERDMWWGAGYAVAQDRLFQLELFRRATTGRLAEILGPSYLDDDLVARRDYYTAEERAEMAAKLPERLRDRTAAYRDGVNAWIAHTRTNPGDLPGEFAALGVVPVDWTLDDSWAVGVFLARTVPSGDGAELDNLRALRAIGREGFDTLLPLHSPDDLETVPAAEGEYPSQPGRTPEQEAAAFDRSIEASRGWPLPEAGSTGTDGSELLPGLPGRTGGSLMFAMPRPGGGALLFNGPQLGYSIPELFVELELHRPGFDIRGVTAAGVPLIGIGHNGKVAWGFTSGLSDEDDLYVEDLVGNAREIYRFDGRAQKMDCRDERFVYRSPPTDLLGLPNKQVGAGVRTERICRTVHGPVQARADGVAYARRYAIWKRELESFVGITMLNEARSVGDVDEAMEHVTWNENVIAADSQGNIGYWHPGLHPLRPTGYDERLPYPGTGEAEWRGLLDRETQTPRVINPSQGWLANWNNMPSEGWTNGDAPARERLSGDLHRVGWLNVLVRDLSESPSYEGAKAAVRRSGTVAQQRPLAETRLAGAATGADGRAKQVLDALLAWNGSYHDTDAEGTVDPGVAIWEEFKDRAEAIALERLGAGDGAGLAGGTSSSHQFDITNGEAYALRTLDDAALRAAAAATFDRLAERFGTEQVARWREPRRTYRMVAQGAAATPTIPFFDRGTWEQVVELAP